MFSTQAEIKDTIPSPPPPPPPPLNAEKIKRLINLIKHAVANAKTAADKDIVLVIGPSGAGKSTLINCFMHQELIAVENDIGDYEFTVKDSKDGTARISHHYEPCTRYPKIYLAKEGLAFCDTAELFYIRRDKEYSQYDALRMSINTAKSLKGILFVCDIETMKSSSFINVVRCFTAILHTNEEYGRSVFFLITKTQGVKHKHVMAVIKKQRTKLGQDEQLVANLLDILINNPDSVITVSPEDLIGKAGLDFASKIYERLKGAQLKPEHFNVGRGKEGKDEYLQAYQHLIDQAFNHIRILTWKLDDLTAAESAIKTIEQNISNTQTLITTTEEKLKFAKNFLIDKKAENERELKVVTEPEITIQTDNGRQIQQIGEKLIWDLEVELTRKKQAALNYETALRQNKERRTNLLKDLNATYQEFMGMKSNYDAMVDLFTLLKLRENYLEFISAYEGFLKTLFIKVTQLVIPTAIPPDSKNGGKPTWNPFESKTPDTEHQRANDVFISQLIGNASLLRALFYEGARGVRDLEEHNTFFDRREPASRTTCFMNTLQRQVILLHQLQKQGLDYKFVQDDKHLNHILDCGEKGRILLPELRIEHKGDQLSDVTKEQFRFLLATHLSKGREDRPLFIPVHLPGHFTLLSLEKRDNKVYYRYIDSLHNFTPDEDADRAIKTKLSEIIQSVIGSPPLEISTPYLKQQTNGSGEHYNECAMHTIFGTLHQLKRGISADMGSMRAYQQIPGRNVTGNGGLDSEDALGIIPNYRSLCESLNEQVKAAAKASRQEIPSAASSSSTLYGRRSPSPVPGAEQLSSTLRATS